MAASQTSLSLQLKKLETPATSQFKEKKGKYSFLYTYHEAAGIDCDTHYTHCLQGLETLSKSHPELDLSSFHKSLFSESSKTFARGVQSQEENELLDGVIESFLFKVITPCFLQESCHKIIEYLIYKYQVSEYNTDALIMATLPYHETNLFTKILQTIPEMKSHSNKWKTILHSCQRNGVHLPKASLLAACVSNPWLLHDIQETTKRISKECGNRSSVFVSFSAAVFIGILAILPSFAEEGGKEESQHQNLLSSILQFIETGIRSKSQQFVLSAYSVVAMLSCKICLKNEVVILLMSKLCKRFSKYSFKESIEEHFTLLLAIMIDNQELDEVPEDALNTIISSGALILKERPQFTAKLMERLVSIGDKKSMKHLKDLIVSNPEALSHASNLDKAINWQSLTSSKNHEEKVRTAVLMLFLAQYHPKVAKKLNQLTNDAKLAVDVIDELTLVDNGIGLTQRLPFDVKTKGPWKSVLMILEVFSCTKQSFVNSNCLVKSCLQLLAESFVLQEEADTEYLRQLLNRTIFRCIDCHDFDLDSFEMQRVMESLRYFRKKESIEQTLRLILKIVQKSETKDQKKKLLDNLMILFAFSFGTFSSHSLTDDVEADDSNATSLFNSFLKALIPSFTTNDHDQQSVVDTVLDSLYDVIPTRRINLVNEVIKQLKGDWFPYVVLSLIHKSMVTVMAAVKDLYPKFCSQLLLSRMGSSMKATSVLEILIDLSALLLETTMNSEGSLDKKLVTPAKTSQRVATRMSTRKNVTSESVPGSSSTAITREIRKVIGNSCYLSLRNCLVSSTSLDKNLMSVTILSIMSRVLTDFGDFETKVNSLPTNNIESSPQPLSSSSKESFASLVTSLQDSLKHLSKEYKTRNTSLETTSINNKQEQMINYHLNKCLKSTCDYDCKMIKTEKEV